MTLSLFLCFATFAAYLGYNILSRQAANLARGPSQHMAMQAASAFGVTYRGFPPLHQNKICAVRFYVGGAVAGTPTNPHWGGVWHNSEGGLRLPKPARLINLEEVSVWNL
ncbi:MAG: hypothetical protein AAF222_11145 [Pseudomonadota bacterium]